jgi:uncharacterized protein with HEPN domain
VTRSPARRLDDILLACDRTDEHLQRGPAGDPLADGLVFDAVRVRLMEIGEAVKDLPSTLTAAEPDLPWREIVGMRDQLAHRYFDTNHAILSATVRDDLPERRAIERLLDDWRCPGRPGGPARTLWGQERSKRSRVMTLFQAATKSRTNFSVASDEA